jgi:CheY-like chemotaxis protein
MAFFDLFRRKPAAPVTARPAAPAAQHDAAPLPPAPEIASPEHDSPLQAADPSPLHAGPERREKIRRGARPGIRALVIDDSPTIVALIRRMLQQNAFEVLEALDAESGIEIARRELPDLVLLDIVLPGMDGFNALRTLRRDPLTKDVPVIMISGNAQATEQFYVQRIGADDFMKKPFSRAELFSRIEALLDEDGIPRHHARPGTRAEAAALAAAEASPD